MSQIGVAPRTDADVRRRADAARARRPGRRARSPDTAPSEAHGWQVCVRRVADRRRAARSSRPTRQATQTRGDTLVRQSGVAPLQSLDCAHCSTNTSVVCAPGRGRRCRPSGSPAPASPTGPPPVTIAWLLTVPSVAASTVTRNATVVETPGARLPPAARGRAGAQPHPHRARGRDVFALVVAAGVGLGAGVGAGGDPDRPGHERQPGRQDVVEHDAVDVSKPLLMTLIVYSSVSPRRTAPPAWLTRSATVFVLVERSGRTVAIDVTNAPTQDRIAAGLRADRGAGVAGHDAAGDVDDVHVDAAHAVGRPGQLRQIARVGDGRAQVRARAVEELVRRVERVGDRACRSRAAGSRRSNDRSRRRRRPWRRSCPSAPGSRSPSPSSVDP